MADAGSTTKPPLRVGCVSYLNAKPLVHGLDPARAELRLDVPSKLVDRLRSGGVDLALCSVVDLFHHGDELEAVPVGGIACEGPTLTVRLFSRAPIDRVAAVHADTDSHTSVALLRVAMHELYGRSPQLVHYDARTHSAGGHRLDPARPPAALLLIGDKVVTQAPSSTVYPYQLDLGAAWHDLTGKPFVFAVWMKRLGVDLGALPDRLAELLEHNLRQIDAITQAYAADHGWPLDLAADYLGNILRYRIGPRERDAVEDFKNRLAKLSAAPEKTF